MVIPTCRQCHELLLLHSECFLKENALPKPRPDKRRAATAGDSLAKVAGVDKLDNQVSYFICKYPPAGIIGRTLRHGKTLINCKP